MKFICNYATIKFVTWPHEPEKDLAASRKFSCSHPIEEWSLYFSLSWCRFGLIESGFWTKYLSVRNNERKKNEILRRGEGGGGMKVSTFPKERMSIRMGVSVSVTWLCILSGGWRLFSINRGDVCNSEESSGRESTEIKLFTLRLNHDRVVSWFNFSDLGLFPLRHSHVVLLDLKAVNFFNYLA